MANVEYLFMTLLAIHIAFLCSACWNFCTYALGYLSYWLVRAFPEFKVICQIHVLQIFSVVCSMLSIFLMMSFENQNVFIFLKLILSNFILLFVPFVFEAPTANSKVRNTLSFFFFRSFIISDFVLKYIVYLGFTIASVVRYSQALFFPIGGYSAVPGSFAEKIIFPWNYLRPLTKNEITIYVWLCSISLYFSS